jgi:hypothetical protein
MKKRLLCFVFSDPSWKLHRACFNNPLFAKAEKSRVYEGALAWEIFLHVG